MGRSTTLACLSSALLAVLGGCRDVTSSAAPTTEPNAPITLAELAPVGGFPDMQGTPLVTTNLSVTVFDVPADQLRRLSRLWNTLGVKGVRFRSHEAFRRNAFRIARAEAARWPWVLQMLAQAGALQTAQCSLWLDHDTDTDLTIKRVPLRQPLLFTSEDNSPNEVTVGPGRLVLRFRSHPSMALPNLCRLTVVPAFTAPLPVRAPYLEKLAKDKEVTFWGAGCQLSMEPGQFFILGPEEYYGDSSTLGGLFFVNPGGVIAPRSPGLSTAQLQPAVRILVVACTAVHQE